MDELPPNASREAIEEFVSECIERLSLEEKVYMMSGHGFFERYLADGGAYNRSLYQTGGGNERLGLPALWFTDGPRGVAVGNSTCFPVSMARGASWDPDLEQRIGEAMGKELRAQGGNFFGGVCINLLRHPAWGRAQETYGEDSYHVGEMGAALVRGVQSHNVISAVKHFAANSIENSRFEVDVKIPERVLHEVYLPHFKRCIDEGAASVMSAYNKVNGSYCGHNEVLLRKILKKQWGFRGFVHSDFLKGIYGAGAAAAGLDVENPETIYFGENLLSAVESGEVTRDHIDEAVGRILTTLLEFSTRKDPQSYDRSLVACPEHRALAREAAEKSAVLLENDRALLPLDRNTLAKIAVIGKLAEADNLGDHGSSRVRPPCVVTPLEGLRDYLGTSPPLDFNDGSRIEAAVECVRNADVAIVVAGYDHRDEGEYIPADMTLQQDSDAAASGGDRDDLNLPAADEELILAITEANPNTVVVLIGGSAIMTGRWHKRAGAILMAWYPGMEGGHALARILFGEVNPSGKLPFSVPRDVGDLPFFDKQAREISYGLYHGYTKLDRDGLEPAYAFGFGLSYSSFEYAATNVEVDGATLVVSSEIRNAGDVAGAEIAQLYVGFENSGIDRPRKLLRGFKRIEIAPGETVAVSFRIEARDLAYYDEQSHRWELEDIEYRAWIAPSSRLDGINGAPFRLA